MYTAGLQPNIMTYVTLLSSYAELGSWQHALQVLNHMCQPQVRPGSNLFYKLSSILCSEATIPYLLKTHCATLLSPAHWGIKS